MLLLRRLWLVLAGAWGSAFLVGAILGWGAGLDGWWLRGPTLAAAAAGAVVSLPGAVQLEAMPARERRDTILGWGTILGGVATVACLVVLPLPWSVAAAAVVVALTVLGLRRVPPAGGAAVRAASKRR